MMEKLSVIFEWIDFEKQVCQIRFMNESKKQIPLDIGLEKAESILNNEMMKDSYARGFSKLKVKVPNSENMMIRSDLCFTGTRQHSIWNSGIFLALLKESQALDIE